MGLLSTIANKFLDLTSKDKVYSFKDDVAEIMFKTDKDFKLDRIPFGIKINEIVEKLYHQKFDILIAFSGELLKTKLSDEQQKEYVEILNNMRIKEYEVNKNHVIIKPNVREYTKKTGIKSWFTSCGIADFIKVDENEMWFCILKRSFYFEDKLVNLDMIVRLTDDEIENEKMYYAVESIVQNSGIISV